MHSPEVVFSGRTRSGTVNLMLAPLLLLTLTASISPGEAARELFKGSALYRNCQAEVRLMDLPSLGDATKPDLADGSYCVGFLNGFTGNLNANSDGVCTNGASTGAVVRAYTAFMEKNPKLMEQDRRVGVGLALQAAYPCPASHEPRLKDPSTAKPRSL